MSSKEVPLLSKAKEIEMVNMQRVLNNNSKETLLHKKARQGDFYYIKLLIQTGLDLNARNHSNKTPIMLAMENIIEGKFYGFVEAIQILYNANADIDLSDDCFKRAAKLALNHSNSIVDDYVPKAFLKIIDDECTKKNQNTADQLMSLDCPLRQAVLLGSAEIIEGMILRGCSLDSCHVTHKFTALHRAIYRMDLKILEVLIQYADLDVYDPARKLPSMLADTWWSGKIQQPEVMKILFENSTRLRTMSGNSLLNECKILFLRGNKEDIQLLLQYRSDLMTSRDRQGMTVLHYLAQNSNSNVLDILHNQVIDVNVTDGVGRTPLFMATDSSHKYTKIFKFLLKKGADVNATTLIGDDGHHAPLFRLCQNFSITQKTYYKIIAMFLQYGLDVQLISPNGLTVFDIIKHVELFYTAEPLVTHLAILDESQQPIIELIRDKINSYEVFKNVFDKCKTDLAKMKHSNNTENLMLYTILVYKKSEKEVLKKFRYKPDLVSNFNEMKTKFKTRSYFNTIVQKRISSIVLYLELFEKAGIILCELLKLTNNPSHLVVTEVIDYLNNQDLHNLLKVEI